MWNFVPFSGLFITAAASLTVACEDSVQGGRLLFTWLVFIFGARFVTWKMNGKDEGYLV